MPKVYQQLAKVFIKLEKHYRDMQDIEFTVENNKLWMLQTRSGKRTAKAAIKIAVDMVKEKLISKKEAILRIDPNILDTLLHPTLDEKVEKDVIASGLPASPGAASGKVVFTADEAERLNGMMQDTILVEIRNISRRYSWHACCKRNFNSTRWNDKSCGRSCKRHGKTLCFWF